MAPCFAGGSRGHCVWLLSPSCLNPTRPLPSFRAASGHWMSLEVEAWISDCSLAYFGIRAQRWHSWLGRSQFSAPSVRYQDSGLWSCIDCSSQPRVPWKSHEKHGSQHSVWGNIMKYLGHSGSGSNFSSPKKHQKTDRFIFSYPSRAEIRWGSKVTGTQKLCWEIWLAGCLSQRNSLQYTNISHVCHKMSSLFSWE